jgi:AraC-like DNA-binding protein
VKHLKGIRFGVPFIRRIGVLKDTQAHRIRWNAHDGLEVHYVLKGMCAWEIDGRDEPVSVPGGAFMAIPPSVRHRPIGENAAPSTRLGVIYEKPPLVRSTGVSFAPEDLEHLFRGLEERAFTILAIPPWLLHVLKEVRDAVTGFTTGDDGLRLRILNELLLVETVRALKEGNAFLPRNGEVVPQICEWIRDHLDSCFSIDSLVRLSGYGRSRFFSLFFAETGMSPNDYVVRKRIERAQMLLRQDGRSILEVALACGFKSASTFSATFTKFTGVSPRKFRDEAARQCRHE